MDGTLDPQRLIDLGKALMPLRYSPLNSVPFPYPRSAAPLSHNLIAMPSPFPEDIANVSDEGVVILSGGLTIHTFKEFDAWDPKTAPQGFKDFESAVVSSARNNPNPRDRNEAMKKLTQHPFFRRAHPREEHFVPIYIAAGAGSNENDKAVVLADIHSAISIAFGA